MELGTSSSTNNPRNKLCTRATSLSCTVEELDSLEVEHGAKRAAAKLVIQIQGRG